MLDGNVADLDNKKPCPSIHMPCRASRLTLILSDVKFEQLQDINRANTGADGVELRPPTCHPGMCSGSECIA
jgi:hypothetical protein